MSKYFKCIQIENKNDASCILQASESIDRLVYICQTDISSVVQDQAKAALMSLGTYIKTYL